LTVGAVGAVALAGPAAAARAFTAAADPGPSAAATTAIHDIQREAHTSPRNGQTVAEFSSRASDHDPQVARISLG
jgi:hypothetical protein